MVNIIFLILLLFSCQLHCSQIALSFDDTPMGNGAIFTGPERTKQMIDILKNNDIKEVGIFCSNLNNLNDSNIQRINDFADAGHIIANHTTSHFNLASKKVSVMDFIRDIEDADKRLSVFQTYKRWFRYPYLQQASYGQKNNNKKVEQYLYNNNYSHGYITIITPDWYLNMLLTRSMRNKVSINFHKLKKLYLEVIWQTINFYDNLAKKVIGKSPKHVILLHENDINALYLKELIHMIKRKSWEIIDISEAYRDDIASIKNDELNYSQIRITSIAKNKGYKGKLSCLYNNPKYLSKRFKEVIE